MVVAVAIAVMAPARKTLSRWIARQPRRPATPAAAAAEAKSELEPPIDPALLAPAESLAVVLLRFAFRILAGDFDLIGDAQR